MKVKVNSLSRFRLFATPWTVGHQAPRSMGFSRQEYWSGLPFPSPGDLPDPGIQGSDSVIETSSSALQADALTSESPGKPQILQARLQQYVNSELPDVQAGFRKGRGTRDQIARICWIIEKAREFQKNIYFCFIDLPKPLTVCITINCGKFFKRWEYQTT